MKMPVTAVEKEPKEPLYQKLANLLESMIRNQSLKPGDRMPSVRHFGQQQRVSVPTALQAYATLETRGWIEARPKSGFFVRARQSELVRVPVYPKAAPRVTPFARMNPLDSLMADHNNPNVVPFGAALPSPELLPSAKLARLMATIARQPGSSSTDFDVAPGSVKLRAELARRSLEWGGGLNPADFIITNGATEGLSLALRALCEPGDTVIVETPTYFGLADMLRVLRLNALPIRVDSAQGIDLDCLASTLRRKKVAACALIPTFHNPVGFVMPETRKRELLALLEKHGIPLIEDDIYGDLQHEGPRPRCIKAFDTTGSVILCSSFTKTLAPGYRVGYVAAGKWHDRVLALKKVTSFANATLPTLAVAEFLRNGGYDRYLRSLRQAYRAQVGQMREAIVQSFPEGIALSSPQGSFMLWCELPPKVDSLALYEQARAAGISIAPGPLFSPQGDFRNYVRINCGYPWSSQIERAVGVLGHLVRQGMK